jgi:hypothetical protein
MLTTDIKKQLDLVKKVAASASSTFDYLMLNFEIGVVEGDRTDSLIALEFFRRSSEWEKKDLRLPNALLDEFVSLWEAASPRWSSFTLEVERSGLYEFSFSYSDPPRLNGVYTDESMFNNYEPRSLE